jgi:hypothetical protein
MTTSGALVVTTHRGLGRDLGVAIVNPQNSPANVTWTLRNAGGNVVATKAVTLASLQQSAEFVSQLFEDRSEIQDFSGTLTFESSVPVAAVGLRFRGQNFSTLPIVPLAPTTTVPPLAGGAGGGGAFILPQFAVGEGWASEIVVMNFSTQHAHEVQVDFFNQNGTPMTVNVNGQTRSSFPLQSIPPGGVLILSTRDTTGNSPF